VLRYAGREGGALEIAVDADSCGFSGQEDRGGYAADNRGCRMIRGDAGGAVLSVRVLRITDGEPGR